MLIDLAEVVVFHHALGLTGHVLRFADGLRAAGHTVHAPDLYDGRTFHTIDDGMAHVDELGGPMAIVERARAAVAPLPNEAVYIGFSLGVLSAQALAQTRAGARPDAGRRPWRGALLLGRAGGRRGLRDRAAACRDRVRRGPL